MEFLKLIEALATNLTSTNIQDAIALVEKLITLAESIDKQANS